MTKVINLIGASGAGKTTIARELEKMGYNIIHSYTTRKPREENEWGHRFIEVYGEEGATLDNGQFKVEALRLDKLGNNRVLLKEMIAYEELYGEHYFATDEQVERGKANIYIVTPSAAEQVKEFYKGTDIEVINICLVASEFNRERRTIDRLQDITDKKLIEVYERIREDEKIFSVIKTDYVVDANRSIEDVFESITEILEG